MRHPGSSNGFSQLREPPLTPITGGQVRNRPVGLRAFRKIEQDFRREVPHDRWRARSSHSVETFLQASERMKHVGLDRANRAPH